MCWTEKEVAGQDPRKTGRSATRSHDLEHSFYLLASALRQRIRRTQMNNDEIHAKAAIQACFIVTKICSSTHRSFVNMLIGSSVQRCCASKLQVRCASQRRIARGGSVTRCLVLALTTGQSLQLQARKVRSTPCLWRHRRTEF